MNSMGSFVLKKQQTNHRFPAKLSLSASVMYGKVVAAFNGATGWSLH